MNWLDFTFDDNFGPLLKCCEDWESNQTNEASVMDDGCGQQIQETDLAQRPARMVGQSGLDSINRTSMEACASGGCLTSTQQGGRG